MKNLIKKIRQPKILRPLILVLVILTVVIGYVFYQLRTSRIFIDDSLVDAPAITISPTISGRLTELDVYEGEKVSKGDSLAIVGGQTLYAETNGLITSTNKQIGSLVSSQTPVVQLIRSEDMRIAGTLDENKGLSDIVVGQVVSFTVDALPGKTFWGYVDEISPTAKSTQNAFSISSERPTQQFVVYAKFDGAQYPAIKNGMSAKMTIFTNTK